MPRRRFTVGESSQMRQFELSLSSLNSISENNTSTDSSIMHSNTSNELDDINSIYRLLRSNVDSEVATAATIAMYSRRLSIGGSGLTAANVSNSNTSSQASTIITTENSFNDTNNIDSSTNQHQILVSRVSMSVESNETVSLFKINYKLNFVFIYD